MQKRLNVGLPRRLDSRKTSWAISFPLQYCSLIKPEGLTRARGSYTTSGCKSLWLKASAKWINVNGFCLKQQSGVLCVRFYYWNSKKTRAGCKSDVWCGRERKNETFVISRCALDPRSVTWKRIGYRAKKLLFSDWSEGVDELSPAAAVCLSLLEQLLARGGGRIKDCSGKT